MTSHAHAVERQALADSLLRCGPWHCIDEDQALIDHANAQARAVMIDKSELDAEKALALAIHRAESHHLTPPKASQIGQLARLACPIWWRRQLRRLTGRRREQRQRILGRVHDRAGIYVSEEGYKRRRAQKYRNAALMEAVNAINELEQCYTLAELAELGLANPDNRRAELMLRVADTEREANRLGHVGLFLTLTTPSRFHAVHRGTARVNSKWERAGHADPREAQSYLQNLWARARAFLGRRGLGFYGLRVVEPHHDGAPHWHMLLWCDQQDAGAILGVLRQYALEDNPSEVAGRESVRFDAKMIDPNKGSAAGYVLKYVTKNINGQQFNRQYVAGDHLDNYGHDLNSSAPRIEAWAATWGIRQFQFFGLPSVTVWRQTRRLQDAGKLLEWVEDSNPGDAARDLMGALWRACDTGDWAEFLRLMGGPMTKREDQPVKPWTIERHKTAEELQTGAYGEVKTAIIGVQVLGVDCMTQQHFWRVEQGRAVTGFELEGLNLEGEAFPWTCVNNCTHQHHEGALDDWEFHITQSFRRMYPPADPETVKALRHEIEIERQRDDIRLSMQAEKDDANQRRRELLAESWPVYVAMLANGEIQPQDIPSEVLESV